jgi:hypothetical protein
MNRQGIVAHFLRNFLHGRATTGSDCGVQPRITGMGDYKIESAGSTTELLQQRHGGANRWAGLRNVSQRVRFFEI